MAPVLRSLRSILRLPDQSRGQPSAAAAAVVAAVVALVAAAAAAAVVVAVGAASTHPASELAVALAPEPAQALPAARPLVRSAAACK